MKSPKSLSVPSAAQPTYDAVTAITDSFCRDHLNDEYRDLARAMTAGLCRKRTSPLTSGQPRTWACGIIYVLGQVNFLTDKSSKPFMATADVCAAFGVSQSTVSAKARVISDALRTHCMDPRWTLRSLIDQNHSTAFWSICATCRRPPLPSQRVDEDRRKAPSPPPPSRGGDHESHYCGIGNPQRFTSLGYRSSHWRQTGIAVYLRPRHDKSVISMICLFSVQVRDCRFWTSS